MRERSVTRALAGWCAVGLLALTACGGETPPRTAELDRETSESTAPEATTKGSPEAAVLREGEVGRGANAASTPQEKEVTEAWFTYLEEVFLRVLGTPEPSGFQLRDLADGPALTGPLRYAGELAEKDLRMGGGMIATVLKIEVDDKSAVVHGCFRTNMVEVDTNDKPVEKLTKPWYETKHTLEKWGDHWHVVDHDLDGAPKCA